MTLNDLEASLKKKVDFEMISSIFDTIQKNMRYFFKFAKAQKLYQQVE